MLDQFNWRLAARHYPAVTLLLLASLLGGALASWGFPLARVFLFGGLDEGQYWRLISPIFLHFGLMHLAFNGLWLAMLGSRIEQLSGSLHLILLVLVSGAFSNWLQFTWQGSAFFGGMSGVVYALLGYIWIKSRFVSHPLLQLPAGVLGFMLVWLLVGMSGILEGLLGAGISNGAHLGGLLIGMLLGMIFGLISAKKS